MDDYFKSKLTKYYFKKFCINHLENFGNLSKETTFEYLAKYQHYEYLDFLTSTVLKTAF